MAASAIAAPGGRAICIRGRAYPVLLPTVKDPRLHLAVVILSLQALGQIAFDFKVSIAQILISLATCAVIESGIAFFRQHLIMWPASALITGNGVSFILRVPGTEHGDWWSMKGWWIYAGTAAVSILSKHLVKLDGRHIFNPSNFGLVLCFLVLGESRAEPLDFWWGPMDAWMVVALAIIVGGGFAILTRLKLLHVAVAFWLTFAAGLGLLTVTGHAMSARWHIGPVTDAYFWWVLVTSPEILVFLFFMISDPKTIPASRRGRIAYAVAVGILATILIAAAKTEFWAKVAVLGALTIVCVAWPLLKRYGPRLAVSPTRTKLAAAGVALLALWAAGIVTAGIRARPVHVAAPLRDTSHLPAIEIGKSQGVSEKLDGKLAQTIAADLVRDLRLTTRALVARNAKALEESATFDRLPELRKQLRAAHGRPIVVPTYRLDQMDVHLEQGNGQGAAIAVAALTGTQQLTTYDTSTPPMIVRRVSPAPYSETLELQVDSVRWLVARVRRPAQPKAAPSAPVVDGAAAAAFAGVQLTDLAAPLGLDFRHGAFRFGVTADPPAYMGGGVCWLDYDNDGWLDLFAVNSYGEGDIGGYGDHLPQSALYRNNQGLFTKVYSAPPTRGEGCVAGDLNGDGLTDLYVTSAQSDQLLWNNGDGTFTEGARAAGVASFGWHAGAAIGDVNGDGLPDLFVAGYTEPQGEIPGSGAGFPTNHLGVRDELFLNLGHKRFKEVGAQVGLDPKPFDHSLGAVFTDANGDGRLDLYVSNDLDPNRLYINRLASPYGFRFVEQAEPMGVADPNAGMGIAAGDYSGDGRQDLFVSNSRGQGHAAYRTRATGYTDVRDTFNAVIGENETGWGDSWVDLNNDGNLDLVLANGSIPVRNLAKDAKPIQVLENVPGGFVDATGLVGVDRLPLVNGRGVAAADFDNDGHVDLAVSNVGGKLMLLRATGGTGHWLEVKLPRFAPGAVVTVTLASGRKLTQEVHAGSSYLSSENPRVHFGLGDEAKVLTVKVRYPDGHSSVMGQYRDRIGIQADRVVTALP